MYIPAAADIAAPGANVGTDVDHACNQEVVPKFKVAFDSETTGAIL